MKLPNSKLPFDIVQVDIKGLLIPSHQNNRLILIFIRHFTRFIELYKHTVDDIIRCLHTLVGTYGVPLQITTEPSLKQKKLTRKSNVLESFEPPRYPNTINPSDRHQEHWETAID
ncbi:hypothetical protein SNEBB_003880 [Seison nebaliae]|nr:hypothetical protein SNEBB_003880 [Seison nebaliae]